MGIRSLAAEYLPSALQGLPGVRAPAPDEATQATTTFEGLRAKLSYLGKADLKKVREAYRFADEAHLGQFRTSGEAYITHPIAVAALCAEWRLDAQAIMAALMHDAMEDCGVTKAQIIESFGAPTAELVDGLTKLDKLHIHSREHNQAESFRKMLLAMARDVRVILIKLADRLHNMRTMAAMESGKRSRIARETLDIYAPLAHRLGLNHCYRELQELAFAYYHPWRHAVLTHAVQRSRGYRRDIVERVQNEITKALARAKIKVRVHGREKTVYSIYRKMLEKHTSFALVDDIFGFRVIVPELFDCYHALGALHQLYRPVPGRFKDYIAIAKTNGYQSLHTTLVSPLGTAIEIQVRTEAMNAVAEQGIAAHWLYKAKELPGAALGKPDNTLWLQSLIDIQSETRDAGEFLEHVKIDLFPDAVYVFTPMSKILALPRGATPVDFAYAIHSDVGDHCVAANVNGDPVTLRTELRSGDVIEIVTAPGARPNPGWLNFVRTGRARSSIRHFLKTLEHDESCALGEQLLTKALRAEGLSMPAGQTEDGSIAPFWQQVVKWSGARSRSELLSDLGRGKRIATIVAKRMALLLAEQGVRPDAVTLTLGRYGSDDTQASQGVVFIDGGGGAAVQLATCCRPIPGDAILGYLGRGEGLLVHTTECTQAKRLLERDRERWMPVEWADELTRGFESQIHVLVRNGQGVLARVAAAVSQAQADILHIDMGRDKASETTELKLLLSVRDRQHLADVLRTLKRSPTVLRVHRSKH